MGGAVIFLKQEFNLDPYQVGFAVSSAVIGCMAGPLIGARFCDWFGRKKTLLFTALLFGIGAVGTALPRNMVEFNIYRILGGIGVGLASVVSPMYIAEIAPARIRGTLVTINQLAIVTGAIVSIVVSYVLAFSGSWRWMFASECVPVIWLVIGLAFIPESPRWLAQKGRTAEALNILTRIEGAGARLEMNQITESVAHESGSFAELLQPGIRAALFMAMTLAALQQLTGVSTLLFYTPVVFQQAGFPNAVDAILQSIFVGIINLIFTFVAFRLVDRVGRRPLLIWGLAWMGAGMAGMGLLFYWKIQGIAVLVMLSACVAAYVVSIAPLAWLIMAEVFPNRIRGRAMALASFCVWGSAFISNQAFPPLLARLEQRYGTPAGAFWIYSAVCVLGVLFSWRFVPETKGKTLEEIGSSWERRRQPGTAPSV
jgi:SP family arabinose:H+ symporter-like MFS transporter